MIHGNPVFPGNGVASGAIQCRAMTNSPSQIVNVARLRLFAPLWRRIRVLAIWSSFDDPFRGRDCGLASFIPALWPFAFSFHWHVVGVAQIGIVAPVTATTLWSLCR